MMVWSHILMNLYLSISDIEITSGGSGYTSPPTITIAEPTESWGIRANATGTITNGVLTSIDMISNGRGYTSAHITIGGSAGYLAHLTYILCSQ